MQLAEIYNVPYQPSCVERGTSAELSDAYMTAMKSYANEKWGTALSQLESISPPTPEIKLYISNCLIKTNRYTEAQDVLSQINSSDKEIIQNKEWYQVIGFLGAGNEEQAKSLLRKISADTSHLFNSRSAKLLAELN